MNTKRARNRIYSACARSYNPGAMSPSLPVLALLCLATVASALAQPASLKGPGDHATFYIFKDQDRIATITSDWQPGGEFHNKAVIAMAGQTATFTTDITVDEAGLWTKFVSVTSAGEATTVRDGASGSRSIKDKTVTFKIEDGARIFDNYGPALMSQAVRLYDRAKGGKQSFPLIVLPGAAVQASLEFRDRVERTVGGRDFALFRYLYSIAGVEITVWADAEDKLYLADVPAQNAAFVREGYEALRKPETPDATVSQPTFDVTVQSNVMVRMRDAIRLATDLYLPKTDAKVPVILVRTPYQKTMAELQARYYARRGYAVAVQDCRGRFASDGIWEPFIHEPHDGYDTIEWLARQPWSTGKVGMIGGSYVGWVQWWAARERPPHLTTIIPNVAPPDGFYNIPYEYGAFFTLGAIWWADLLESKATADLSGAAFSKISEKKFGPLLNTLPVIDLDKAVLGRENPYWRKWIAHPTDDAWWAESDFLDKLRNVNIPVFHQSGWFDGDGIGTKLNYLRMKEYGHANQKLTVGPWGHTDTAARRLGDHDFGAEAVIDLQRDYLRWFDHWLKGMDNGILKDPLVSVFVMNTNRWLHADTYPLPQTRFTKLYLAGGGKANTSKGDGRLTFDEPPSGAPADHYVYDPGDPTPDPNFLELTVEQEKQLTATADREKFAREHHESVTAARQDILVYQTGVWKEPATFAGPVSATLYASTSAKDTDWYLALVDIDEHDHKLLLCSGKLRARFRNGVKKPELLEPGQIYPFQLDLWHTGITIPAGHRLRVEVASARFPTFSRNLNTGGHNETETKFVSAQQTVYHDKDHPSHVLLPIVTLKPAPESAPSAPHPPAPRP